MVVDPLACTIHYGHYLLDENIQIRENNKYLLSAYHALDTVLSMRSNYCRILTMALWGRYY